MRSLLLRSLPDFFSRELKERAVQNGRTAEEEHRHILETALTEPTRLERQRHAVAKRLNQFLRMLNDGVESRGAGMTIPRMAELIGLNTASGLELYLYGEDEAPFDLLDRIAETFGLRAEWLKFGRYEPFNPRERSVHGLHYRGDGYDRQNLPALVEELRAKRVYFIRCLNDTAYATIFLQVSDWKYEGFYDGWHVSNHVGASGQRQLYELWQLLKMVEEDRDLRSNARGCDLPEKIYLDLVRGEIFPGSVLQSDRFCSHWYDDFTDVYQKMPIARASVDEEMPKNGEGYARYGKGFQQAQALVREYIEYQGAEKERQEVSA